MPITTLLAAPYSLNWGDSVYAKVAATNVIGTTGTSDEGNGAVIFTNPDPPVSLTNDVATTSATTTAMTWSEGAANGGSTVIDYRISHKLSADASFTELASGVTTTSYSTTTLTQGAEYVFKVESRNVFGYSTTFSNEITILQAQVPDTPVTPVNDAAVTSATQIGLTWSAGTFDGASPVIDYRISYDQGTGTWTQLVDGVTSTSYTATGLTADTIYAFKVEARNLVGFSPETSSVSIRAAAIPNTPIAPTTAVNGNNVDVSWTEPYTGGSPITAYTITIRQSDGTTFSLDSTNCDGSDAAIVSGKLCSVPIATMLASPYSLNWGDSVYAKVKATNIVGDSSESSEGNGAVLLTNPDAPVTLANDVATTSATIISMNWSEGTLNGGSSVIDYRISHKLLADVSFTILASGVITTSFSTTALTQGSEYVFKVESRNEFGYSTTFSNEVTILQAQIPDAPVTLANDATVTSASQIGLTWSAGAFDGASTIVDYRISYDQGTGTWIQLIDGITTTSYTATGLIADTVYAFKVEARNIVGFSSESTSFSIRAAAIPDTPSAPTTAVNGNNVDISWTEPYTGGSAITAYEITIRQSDGTTFTVDSTNCDGSDSTILSTKLCSVPITTLMASPYRLNWGDEIYAKVKATNIVGDSSVSSEGNGAVILTNPDAPVTLANNEATTSATTIALTWSEGAANGGTPVIDYRISHKLSADASFTELVSGVTTTSYTTTSLTAGGEYVFKVESRNAFGYSITFSNEVTILQA